MKNILLTIIFTLALSGFAAAQQVSLRQGDEQTVAKALKIHFIEVLDDSRCPERKVCVWAGNAKVKLTLSLPKRKRAKDVELNSNLDPTSIDYEGYRIKFVSLTRRPDGPGRMTMVRPELVLSVTKIKH